MSIAPFDNLSEYTEICMGECEVKACMEPEGEMAATATEGIQRFMSSEWYQGIMREVFSTDEFKVEGGRLLKRMGGGTYTLCLLEAEVPKALRQAHDSALGGHYGKEVTMKRLEKAFWWPTMKGDVTAWFDKCMRCVQQGQKKRLLGIVCRWRRGSPSSGYRSIG